MDRYIDNFATTVREILDRQSRRHNDFVSLAISGEQLRRACETGVPSDEARSTLAGYDQALAAGGYETPTLEELRDAIDDQLGELERYAASSPAERDPADGEDILLAIDEALCIAAAGVRAGAVEASSVAALAAGLTDRVREVAHRCTELAQVAEDRQLLFGLDPRMPTLFDWWEPLAELAPSRLALRATVTEHMRRERLIERALSSYEAMLAVTPTMTEQYPALGRGPLHALLDNLDYDPDDLRPHASADELRGLTTGLRDAVRARGPALMDAMTTALARVAWLVPQIEQARATPISVRGTSEAVDDGPDDETLIALAIHLADALERR